MAKPQSSSNNRPTGPSEAEIRAQAFVENVLESVGEPKTQRRSEAEKYAREFWNHLIKAVGKSEAKKILRDVTGGKKPGRPTTTEAAALKWFLYMYIYKFGLDAKVGKILKYFSDSNPYFVEFESGAVVVVNKDCDEAYMACARRRQAPTPRLRPSDSKSPLI